MAQCGVFDLKCSGRFFTWTNLQAGNRRILCKHDIVSGNHLWEDIFPHAEVSILPERDFDHSSTLIEFLNSSFGKKSFHFFNFRSIRILSRGGINVLHLQLGLVYDSLII